MNKRKKIKNLLTTLIWVIVLILVPMFLINKKDENMKEDKNYISSNFEIQDYIVTLDVNYNNKVDVTEEFKINVTNEEIKGIYKTIPTYMKYYEDGKIKSKKSIISNVRSIGKKTCINKTNEYTSINIGSKKTKLPLGLNEYTIKYRYDLGKDDYKGKDMFIFNIFDEYDDTKINSLITYINMPKYLENAKIRFYNGKLDITNKIDYDIEDKQIIIKINNYDLKEKITIFIELEDNYFSGARNNYGYISLTISILLIIISLIVILLWIKFGKDHDKKIQTIEFRSPDNLDPLIVGYINGEDDIRKLTTSLIISLASKDFIKIDEIEEHRYKLTKIRGYLKDLSANELLVYQELFKNNDVIILNKEKDFGLIYPKLSSSIRKYTDKMIKETYSYKLMNITNIIGIISVILWVISYLYIKDLNPLYNDLYLISFISIFVTIFISLIMDRKTEYGEIVTAKIKGFKDYLLKTTEEELKHNESNLDEYFYKMLPYAYALGISSVWMKKFNKNNLPNLKIESSSIDDTFMIL